MPLPAHVKKFFQRQKHWGYKAARSQNKKARGSNDGPKIKYKAFPKAKGFIKRKRQVRESSDSDQAFEDEHVVKNKPGKVFRRTKQPKEPKEPKEPKVKKVK